MRCELICWMVMAATGGTGVGCGPMGANGSPDMSSSPDLNGGDDFRASWKDDAGCEAYQHWDGTKCAVDNPIIYKNEAACWAHGQVNDWGVNRPCQPGIRECTGFKASCCQVDDRMHGAVCTLSCTVDADCGPNAWCSTLGVCLAAFCKPGFTSPDKPTLYTDAQKGFPCKPAAVPATGLGKACKVGDTTCNGLKAVHCLGDPGSVPNAPSFCTYECKLDADCGAGAVCVYTEAKPYFCSPAECAAQFVHIDFLQWMMPDTGMHNPVCTKPGM